MACHYLITILWSINFLDLYEKAEKKQWKSEKMKAILESSSVNDHLNVEQASLNTISLCRGSCQYVLFACCRLNVTNV